MNPLGNVVGHFKSDSPVDQFGKVTGEKIVYRDNPIYKQYSIAIREAERRNNLPDNSLRDVLTYDKDTIAGIGRNKRIGALGIAQMMPDVAKRFGVHERLNAYESIAGAGRYLKHLLDKFRTLKRAQAAFLTSENKETA